MTTQEKLDDTIREIERTEKVIRQEHDRYKQCIAPLESGKRSLLKRKASLKSKLAEEQSQ